MTLYLAVAQCESSNGSQPQNELCSCKGPTRKGEINIEAVVRPGLGEGSWFLYARGLNGGEDTRPYSLCNSFPVELKQEGVRILIQDSDLPTVACPNVREAAGHFKLNQYQVLKAK